MDGGLARARGAGGACLPRDDEVLAGRGRLRLPILRGAGRLLARRVRRGPCGCGGQRAAKNGRCWGGGAATPRRECDR